MKGNKAIRDKKRRKENQNSRIKQLSKQTMMGNWRPMTTKAEMKLKGTHWAEWELVILVGGGRQD